MIFTVTLLSRLLEGPSPLGTLFLTPYPLPHWAGLAAVLPGCTGGEASLIRPPLSSCTQGLLQVWGWWQGGGVLTGHRCCPQG